MRCTSQQIIRDYKIIISKNYKMKKVLVLAGLVLAFSMVSVASAATIAELQAMIAQLQAQIAALSGTATVSSSAPTITKNLTVGSRGDEVTALQQYLENGGYLVMPAGADYGYFGAITKAAVVAWQKEVGLPSTGYFGPMSRAKLAEAVVTTPITTTPTTPTTGITTPGVEGTLTVNANPTPSSGLTLREGDTNKDVLGLKLEAKLSDISVQRIKVNLGTTTLVYNKLFKKIYVKDGSTVLAESDLNSSTVIKDGSNYYITLTGFNVIAPKGGVKVLTLALDLQPSIDSGYDGAAIYGLEIPKDGVRGVDGAGLSQTAPASVITRTVTIDSDAIVDSASISIATNSGTPVAANIIASDGTSDNEKDGVEFVKFSATVEKDSVMVTDATVTFAKTGTGAATATTAYLYVEGNSDPIGSATINATSGVATFTDIDYTISAGTTKYFIVKADIRSANDTDAVIRVSSVDLTSENSQGTSVVESGSVAGNRMTITNAGLQITLDGKSIVKEISPVQSDISTSSASATFNVKLKALGGPIYLGSNASTAAPMVAANSTFFKTYKNSVATDLLVASSTDFAIPSGVTTAGIGSDSFMLTENQEVVIPVTFRFEGRTTDGALTTGGSYTVGLEGLRYSTDNGATTVTASFMAGETAWRTGAVSLP